MKKFYNFGAISFYSLFQQQERNSASLEQALSIVCMVAAVIGYFKRAALIRT